ncbi:CrcB family protein [Parashewanella curva]|uniref:CrcB family protein n=1 Tax=Parashewanella curva TaxID=2338552 RepID=A0A3L8PTT4_9GAMM|nr:CrcB family protein [Parashewanella curva]RLV57818.1 CrcB family protein [Parashewanella curva]
MNENGTGTFLNGLSTSNFQWIQDPEKGVAITFNGDGHLYDAYTTIVEGKSVNIEFIWTKVYYKILFATDSTLQLVRQVEFYRRYPNGEIENTTPELSPVSYISTYAKESTAKKSKDIIKQGVEFAVPMINTHTLITNDKKFKFGTQSIAKTIFKANNQATLLVPYVTRDVTYQPTKFQELDAQYSIDDNGHLRLSAKNSDDETVKWDYVFHSDTNPLASTMVQQVEEKEMNSVMSADFLQKSSDIKWTADNSIGMYLREWDFFEPLSYFWIEINADGTALQGYTFDDNKDGQISDNEISTLQGLWKINDSGKLGIRLYRDINTKVYCLPSEFTPSEDPDCVKFQEREWELFDIKNNKFHTIQYLHKGFLGDLTTYSTFSVETHTWKKITERPVDLPE